MPFVPKILQERLDTVFLTNGQVDNTQANTPLSNMLRNEANAGALQSKLVNENGQQLDLRLIWSLPECGAVASGCVTDPCAEGSAPTTQQSQAYSLECSTSNTFHDSLTFDYADFLKASALMDSLPDLSAPLTDTSVNGTSIESKLLTLISKVDLAAETAIAKKMIAGVAATTYGFSPDEVPSITDLVTNEGKAVTTTGTGLSAIQNELFSGVTMSAEIAEYKNQPWLIGGYPLANYVKLSGGLCCASTGVNLSSLMEINQTPIMTSKALIRAMIAEYPSLAGNFVTMPFFLSYDRGSIQLLNFHTFAGGFGVENGLTVRKQIFSPFTNRPMGLTIAMNACGTKITVRVQTTEDIVFKPETQCEGTAAFGVNGLQQFVIKNS
jgi:hypothetical protein